MWSRLLAFVPLFLLLAACQRKDAAVETPPPPEEKRFVVASMANVRERPEPNAPIAGKLRIGSEIVVVSTAPEWVEVRTAKVRGFVHESLLSTTKPTPGELRARHDELPPDDVKARRAGAERLTALAPKDLAAVERLLIALAWDPDEKGPAFRQAARAWLALSKRTEYVLTEPSTWAYNPSVILTGPGLPDEGQRFSTVQAAVDAAPPGGTVYLPQGIYDATVVVREKKDLTLLAPRGPAFLHVPTSTEDVLRIEKSARITVDNVWMRHRVAQGECEEAAAAGVYDSTDVVFRRVYLNGSGTWGLRASSSKNVALLGSIVEEFSRAGVHTEQSSVLVHATRMRGSRNGVDDAHAPSSEVVGSRIRVSHSYIQVDERALPPHASATHVLVYDGGSQRPTAGLRAPLEGVRQLTGADVARGNDVVELADFRWWPDAASLRQAIPPALSTDKKVAACEGEDIAFLDEPVHWKTLSQGDIGEDETYIFYKAGDVCTGPHKGAEVLLASRTLDPCVCKCYEDSIEEGLAWILLEDGVARLLAKASTLPPNLEGWGASGWPYSELGLKLVVDQDLAPPALLPNHAPPALDHPRKKHTYVKDIVAGTGAVSADVEVSPGVRRTSDHAHYVVKRKNGLESVFARDVPQHFAAEDLRSERPRGESYRCTPETSGMPARLVEAGTTSEGDKIYADPAPSEWHAQRYEAYASGVEQYLAVLPESELQKRPKEELDKSLARFFWKDPFGAVWQCVDPAWDRPEYAEPLVYVYAPAPIDVDIALDDGVEVSVSAPRYEGGWSVRTRGDGALSMRGTGVVVESLFWEGARGYLPLPDSGFVLARDEVLSFLDDALAALGLNGKERDDFVEYWFPRLTESPFVFVAFHDPDVIDADAPLYTLPIADTRLRVHMDYRPLLEEIDVEPGALPAPPGREGLVVVEWSGFRRGQERDVPVLALGPACR